MSQTQAYEQTQQINLMSPQELIQELFRREPFFAATALCFTMLMLPTLFAMTIEERTLLGINIWIKPFKFELALTVYMATLAWFAGWLPKGTTQQLWYRIISITVVICILLEMVWIAGAAGNGVASHFNMSSPFMGAIYGVMGLLALCLTAITMLYAVLFWKDKQSPLNPTFKLSLVIGLGLTLILTAMIGSYMAAGTGHFVGGDASDLEGLALFGWACDGGDLRVPHFFATHSMHFIPFVGFVISKLMNGKTARLSIYSFTMTYIMFIGYTFFLAVNSRPFLC